MKEWTQAKPGYSQALLVMMVVGRQEETKRLRLGCKAIYLNHKGLLVLVILVESIDYPWEEAVVAASPC